MASSTIDELDQRLKKYWDKRSDDGINIPPVKIVICDINGTVVYLPIYMEDRNFVYIASNNIYSIVKQKCKLHKTEKKSLYYEVIPSEDDVSFSRIPIRPMGCPKIISQLALTELAKFEI